MNFQGWRPTLVALSMALAGNAQADMVGAAGWELVWADEFQGESLDLSKWSHEVNCWGGGNSEKQCYVDHAENSFVKDGLLHIRALKQEHTGVDGVQHPDGSYDDPDNLKTLPYTSARLRTLNKGDWRYGRFEIRAKLPQGQGTWPAIWMLPTDWVYGGWAASGEIDIMEAVNLGTEYQVGEETHVENRVHGTLHFGRAWPNNSHAGTSYDFGRAAGSNPEVSPADDFHVYAIEWEAGEIRWYVDGQHYATQRQSGWHSHYQNENEEWVSGPGAAPFDQKFHLLLNLAVGGGWPEANGKGVDESMFPQTLLVDYVRVYQCADDPSWGIGCETTSPDAKLVAGVTEPGLPNVQQIEGDELALDGLTLNGWDGDGGDSRSVQDGVLDISIAGIGNAYLESGSALDMSKFADGELKLDLQLVSLGSHSDVLLKMDSGWPNVSDLLLSDYLPEFKAGSDWHSVTIPVADFIASDNRIAGGRMNIGKVANPLVFEGLGGADLALRVKNIRFETKK